ncbi:hypothetical protein C8A00DRAFT_30102 [Chaetomidium leptoderma]|uniref:Methyltransferase n=1 Tax=Chaetomidium leptoderma TaxID=669021 RepID=A0AAN6VTE8_9PEZI|nr:hypothetical protein C8A00DRAFT_30102 [Chaetomidium leptoderma]
MERLQNDTAISVAPDAEGRSKKRSRAETDASSPTDATFPSTKTAAPRPMADQVPQPGVDDTSRSRSMSREPPSSLKGRRPSLSANDSTSTYSLSDSTLLGSFSPSSSQPSLSTGPRGSLSPPYMFTNPSRPPDSPIEPADDAGDGRTEQDELEEQQAAAQAEDGSIVVDSDELGTDDGYGTDSNTTASTSLAESVRDYIYENGRRYHRFREGRYNFPNDDVEQQREDMKHAMVKMLCGGQLFFAPIGDQPHEILDVGTGTGIWAIEMGDLFPNANVLGIDLSPIQPEWVPPNVRFMVDDVESPWLHPRNYFDYIHSRHTVMAIKDWPKLMRRTLEHLRPGGWFEMQEAHHMPISANKSMPADHPVAQYWSLIHEGLGNLGVNFHAAADGRLAAQMRDCGFVNVTERVLQIPIGTWAKNKVLKTVGLYWRTILSDGIQAIALGPLTRGCGWTREQVELFLIEVRKGYGDNSMLAYMPLHIVYGQKPAGY